METANTNIKQTECDIAHAHVMNHTRASKILKSYYVHFLFDDENTKNLVEDENTRINITDAIVKREREIERERANGVVCTSLRARRGSQGRLTP